jgi:hypothetical protein
MSTFRRRTAKQRHRLVELSPETHVLLDEAMARHHPGNPDSPLQAALNLCLEHGRKRRMTIDSYLVDRVMAHLFLKTAQWVRTGPVSIFLLVEWTIVIVAEIHQHCSNDARS